MANLFKRFFTGDLFTNSNVKMVTGDDDYFDYAMQSAHGHKYSDTNATNISTVFTCIKILSDTLSRLPLNVYTENTQTGRTVDKEDYRYPILHYNPNDYTTSQTFFAALEYYRNLHGNAFARIHRNNATGKVTYLELLPSGRIVGYQKVNGALYYAMTTKRDDGTKVNEMIAADDVLHFKMVTKDGIWGVSPIEALRLNLSTSWKGLQTIDKYYEHNAVSPKALKSSIPDAAYRAKQQEAVKDFKKNYAGPRNAGEMIILPEYTEIQELSISMADAEFINTIKFNSNQIAAAYGVPPHLVGNYEASKFNNVEQLQLNFKANTMNAIARMYRQELEFKLLSMTEREAGKTIEFNFMAFVETDAKTRFEGYKTMFSLGVMPPNTIAKLEGLPSYEGGDLHFIPANYMSVETYSKKQKSETTSDTNGDSPME